MKNKSKSKIFMLLDLGEQYIFPNYTHKISCQYDIV